MTHCWNWPSTSSAWRQGLYTHPKIGKYGGNEREKHYCKCLLSRGDPEFMPISRRVFLRSRASARIGKRKEPPGRKKITAAGMIFTMFLRCLFISFLSSLVHFSSVFRIFIRSCISPLIERTSIRMASLLIMNTLLRYLLIIGQPATTTEFQSLYSLWVIIFLFSNYIYAKKIQTANK